MKKVILTHFLKWCILQTLLLVSIKFKKIDVFQLGSIKIVLFPVA